jgi:hypothetical protein
MIITNLNKVPFKYIVLYGLYLLVPIVCFFILASVFLSGGVHGRPCAFAVDNEQRLYLAFDNGLFIMEEGQSRLLIPTQEYDFALSISEEDILTAAGPSEVRVLDLSQVDITSDIIPAVKRYSDPDNALFGNREENWKTDVQNGVTYRYEGTSFYYEILRDDGAETSVFFAMPHSDYVWHIVAVSAFAFFFIYVGTGVLFIKLFVIKKHPEFYRHVKYPWQ